MAERIGILVDSTADFPEWIAHAAAEEKCDQLLAALKQVVPAALDRIRIADVGPTITVHAGPGCIALGVAPI